MLKLLKNLKQLLISKNNTGKFNVKIVANYFVNLAFLNICIFSKYLKANIFCDEGLTLPIS
jgi:hypothetical protein